MIAVLSQDKTILCEPIMLQVSIYPNGYGLYEVLGFVAGKPTGIPLGAYLTPARAAMVVRAYEAFEVVNPAERKCNVFEMPQKEEV